MIFNKNLNNKANNNSNININKIENLNMYKINV